VSLLISCASKRPEPLGTPPPGLQKPSAAHLSLPAYLPAANLKWLVHVRPRALLKTPGFSDDWSALISKEHLKSFQIASGFDPHQVEELWIAGYPLGTIYLFDASQIGDEFEESFIKRSLTTQYLKTKTEDTVHCTGMIAETPHALVHVKKHFIALVEKDIGLARIIRAYAERDLQKSPSALEGIFLADLANFENQSPLRAFLVGPYLDATDGVAQGFVAGAGALTFKSSHLHLQVKALGIWDDADLSAKMGRWVAQLLDTREMRALGWGFPLEAPRLQCRIPSQRKDPDTSSLASFTQCLAQGVWDAEEIAQATRRITAGNMSELVPSTAPAHWRASSVSPEGEPVNSSSSEPLQRTLAPSVELPHSAPLPVELFQAP